MPEVTPESLGPSSIRPMLMLPVVVITLCAGAALALVNEVTKDPIAESKRAEKAAKLAAVMPAFANDPAADTHPFEVNGNDLLFYAGRDEGGRLTGWGVESATGTAYAGHLSLVFGIDGDGKVSGVELLEQRETPGLGTKAADPAYLEQYLGKGLDGFAFTVAKDGGDVEAISGATITSRAVALCIAQGLEQYEAALEGKDPGPAAAAQGGEQP